MRVLVTGARGLIGYEIADYAQRAGHTVISVDDGRAAVVNHAIGEHHPIPVEAFTAADRINVVVHCAAPVGPVGILHQNVLADMLSSTTAAIQLAASHRAALVVFSSSEVYGTRTPGDSLVVPDEWSPRTEYGVGKIATELAAARHHHETGLPTLVIRPWNVVGPLQSAAKGFVIPRLAEQAIRGNTLTVYTPGDQRRSFMHVRDLAAAVTGLIRDLDWVVPQQSWWTANPVDAAAPRNATTISDLARRFSARVEIVDPTVEHGPLFREAAAGSKLPPPQPAITGTTPLTAIVNEATAAAATHVKAAA